MSILKIYDPAMCCSSGVCGTSVDQTLVKLAAFLKSLEVTPHTVERYNLSQQPDAFVANAEVANVLREKGPTALPLVYVDDELLSSGKYPSLTVLGAILEVGCGDGSSCCGTGGCCD